MDAFENLIAMLLKRQGYWTIPCFKVELSKEEKRQIDRPSSPRWELDLVAYKGSINEIMAVECKSYLDSRGVVFRNGSFEPVSRYKLFTDEALRNVVLSHLVIQLQEIGAIADSPKVTLCLAAGKLASVTKRDELAQRFESQDWKLFDPQWIRDRLQQIGNASYENDMAYIVAKMLLR
jgi:hypothetical protein